MQVSPNPAVEQTQQAMGTPQEQTIQPEQLGTQMPDDDGYDNEVAVNLEAHLDSISDEMKAFIVDNLNPTTITLLGIVNGQEVYDYFSNIYQTQILAQNSGQQPNMASQGAMPTGQTPTTQAKATPAV